MNPPLCPRAVLVWAAVSAVAPACQRVDHARRTSFVRPKLPAGFAEQTGDGWRVAIPSTWKNLSEGATPVWSALDPQPVEDYRANVNMVTEPFAGGSYEYAKATVESLLRDRRATVEVTREDVVDGDPTFIVESRWSPVPPSSLGIRTMQTNLASRGTGYVVTCSVAAGAFERYRSTCEAIVRSLSVER